MYANEYIFITLFKVDKSYIFKVDKLYMGMQILKKIVYDCIYCRATKEI